MKRETSQKLCMFFAITNLGLFAFNELPLNLYIGVIMVGWVTTLEIVRRQ